MSSALATRPGATPTSTAPTEPRPAPRTRTGPRHAAPWKGTGLVVVMVLVVLLQRFLVPPGAAPVSMVLVVAYGGVGVLWLSGKLRVDRVRVELYAVAAVLVLLATALAVAGEGTVSVTSLGLLLALWAPWVLRVAPGHLHVQRRVGRAFVNLMVVLALVGLAQFVSQFLGLWTYVDYFRRWVPGLLQSGFNTSDPIFFGSPVWKSNAFVFVEPSSFSQYCALAAIVALVLRERSWKLLVLGLGLATTVSGTGILLLVVGVALVLLRAPRLLRPGVFVAAGAGLTGILLSPVFPLLIDRADEPNQVGSSGYLRFVQPYTEVTAGLDAAPLRYLAGAGAGAVQRVLESGRDSLGQAVLYPIIPKAVFEYGVIAGGVFILFVVLAVVDRAPWPVVPGAVLFFLFFLGGNLLMPQTVVLAWLLTSLFTEQAATNDTVRLPGRPGRAARAAARRAAEPLPLTGR